MAWVNNSEREPPVEGEYRVMLQSSGKDGGEYERVCAYIPYAGGRKRSGSWYSMTSGGKVANVNAWYEEDGQ